MSNQPKRGRGRPKGAKSFANITLEQLQEFIGPKQPIPVSRVWLEKLNVQVEEEKPTVQSAPKATSSPVVAFELED